MRKQKTTKKRAPSTTHRFREAAKDLRKISKEIAPFIKRQKLTEFTTAGQWREASPHSLPSAKDGNEGLVY